MSIIELCSNSTETREWNERLDNQLCVTEYMYTRERKRETEKGGFNFLYNYNTRTALISRMIIERNAYDGVMVVSRRIREALANLASTFVKYQTKRERKTESERDDLRHAMINGRLKVTILRCLRKSRESTPCTYSAPPARKKGDVARTIFATVQKQIQYAAIYHNFFLSLRANSTRGAILAMDF